MNLDGRKKDEVWLQSTTIKTAREILFGSLWPFRARNAIQAMLLKQQLHWQFGGRDYSMDELNPAFAELVHEYWIPFLKDTYDEMMTAGFVVVKLIKAPTGDTVPVVVSSATLDVTHRIAVRYSYKEARIKYRVMKLRKDDDAMIMLTPKEDKNAFVIDRSAYPPTPDGRPRSPLATLFHWERTMFSTLQNAAQADYTLSDPPLLLQARDDTSVMPSRDGDHDMWTPGEVAQREMDGLYQKDIALTKRMHHFVHAGFGSEPLQWKPRFPGDVKPHLMHNTVALPTATTTATGSMPVRNPLLIDITQTYEHVVAAVFGLPASYFAGSAPGVMSAASTDGATTVLGETMSWLSAEMSRILTRIYHAIYFPTDFCYMLKRSHEKRKLKNKKPLTVDEMFAKTSRKARVSITLAAAPTADMQEAIFLYLQNAIDWREYYARLRSAGGFQARLPPSEPKRKPTDVDEIVPEGAVKKPRPDPLQLAAEYMTKMSSR